MDHHNTQHSVSVAGVIIDDQGRALLTQRRDNGHHQERHEDITTGLLREIHEETGMHVKRGLIVTHDPTVVMRSDKQPPAGASAPE